MENCKKFTEEWLVMELILLKLKESEKKLLKQKNSILKELKDIPHIQDL